MPTINVLTTEDVDRAFAKANRREQREQEMRPFRQAVAQLSQQTPGGIIELDEGDDPRTVMMRLHRAARDEGLHVRFQRSGKNQPELRFRLQTPEETTRLKERGQQLAQSRQAKRQPEVPVAPAKNGRRRASK